MINLKIIDEYNELIQDYGQLNVQDVLRAIDYAEKNSLINMSCVDVFQDTYFNASQLKDVKREIDILQKVSQDNLKNLIDVLKQAIELILKEGVFNYLKFEIRD